MKIKRVLTLILALALCAGLNAAAYVTEFSDVPASHPFHDAIAACAGAGIVGSYADGSFQPGKTVTRSNFCVMLSRAFYAEDVAKYRTDENLKYGSFFPNFAALRDNNVLAHTSFNTTEALTDSSVMNAGISRCEMAVLMTNIMDQKGFYATAAEKSAAPNISDFDLVPHQCQDAVLNVYALGLIGGYPDGTFRPDATMNRGQAAVVIYRMSQRVPLSGPVETPDPTPDPVVTPDPAPVETPVVSGRTLANGKAITEANVTEILDQLKAKYPQGTDFQKGYGGLATGRNPGNNCIKQITDTYIVEGRTYPGSLSTATGCGGWAACVADEIFGQTNVTWKKTTLANARPGDLLIKLNNESKAMHVEIYVSEVTGFAKTQKIYVASATSGNSGYAVRWVNDNSPSTNTIDIYTAYPD